MEINRKLSSVSLSHLLGFTRTTAAREEIHSSRSLNLNFQQRIKAETHLGYLLLYMFIKQLHFESINLKDLISQ